MSKQIEYIETGVPYCPQIPNTWEVKRLKFVGKSIIGITYNPTQVTDKENGILVLRSSNVQNGTLSFEDNVYVNAEISEKHLSKEGDILICARNGSAHLVGKSAYIPKEYEGLTFGAFMLMFRSNYGKFMYYVFNSNLFKSQTGLFATSTINQLTSDTINNLFVALPKSEKERNAIATFLEMKTKEIDNLISKKQELIDCLKEERKSIIDNAVTKGINADVSLKSTGNDFVDKIPEHWKIKRLKHIGQITSGAAFPSTAFQKDGNVKVIKITNVQHDYIDFNDIEFLPDEYLNQYSKFQLRTGDIVFALTRPIISSGIKSAIIYLNEGDNFLLNQRNAFFRSFEGFSNRFIYYITHCRYFYQLFEISMDTTGQQPNISPVDISNFTIVIPDIKEQNEIVQYLDKKTNEILTTINKIEQEINLIKEYRTSLVNEVVTGKITLN